LYAITILVAMAHSMFRTRILLVLVVVAVYLLSAWLQEYDVVIFLVGLFFTLVNGVSVCYQIQALYKQLAIKQNQEEVRILATSTERERIAHDLHDLLGQSLTGISLKAELALKTFEHNPSVTQQQLTEIIDISRNTLKEVREAVSDYRQTTIANEITSARIAFGAMNIKFESDIEPISLEPSIEQALAWVIREATTNAMRHSKANLCQVTLKINNNVLSLIINDNGIGSGKNDDELGDNFGTGIVSIRQRCNTINAQFHLSQTNGYLIKVTKEMA
jgi:two-component system sensor histidine kinase DesK